jgi:ankyrin repeat protein
MTGARRATAAVLIAIGLAPLAAAAGPDLRLVTAAKRNDPVLVRSLLNHGVDVNQRHPDGSTALLWATYHNDAELVTMLMAAGADANAANEYAETPLSLAAQNGNPTIVKQLLQAGADPRVIKPSGETLLMTAARAGHRDVVTMLLAAGVPVNARETSLRQTALMWAAAHQHGEIVETLLAAGADVNAASARGSTALHFAVQRGDAAIARRLLAAGANVHARMRVRQIDRFTLGLVETLDELTPLLLAIADCRQDGPEYDGAASALVPHSVGQRCPASEQLGTLLLDHGADPNAPDGSQIPPLHQAVRAHMPTLVRALLAHGARVNAQIPDTVKQWIGPARRGARTITPMPVGATPFFVAAWLHNVDLMQALLTAGADPRLPTTDRTTPLMAAAGLVGRPAGWSRQKGDTPEVLAAVKLALETGGDVAAANALGQTALHGAAQMGLNDVVQLLVDRGARPDVEDKNGDTPIVLARRAEAHSTVELMNRLRGGQAESPRKSNPK